jgi:hypothetical protein
MAAGRFTKPTEVAALVPLLASDLVAGNIAGADFVIDGCLNPEQWAGSPYVSACGPSEPTMRSR